MSNYTILLIDYEPKSIDRVRRPLTAAGYKVEVATDGLAGMEAFQRLKPDLVILEAMIPKKHGFEVCQELKKTALGKRTPVVITTSVYKGRKYRSQAFHLYGCDEYVEKPVDEQQIVEICRRFLGDAPVQAAPVPSLATAQQVEAETARSAPAPSPAPAAVAEPPAPAALLEDDEMEILARLDAILPGERPTAPQPSRQPPVPPPRPPEPKAVEPPRRVAPMETQEEVPDLFRTAFAPASRSETPETRPATGDDAPSASAAGASVPSFPEVVELADEDSIEIVVEEEQEQEQEQEKPQVVSFEARQARKKGRRGGRGAEAPHTHRKGGAAAVAGAAVVPKPAQSEPVPRPAAAAELGTQILPSPRQERPAAAIEPLEAASPSSSPARWWLWVALALLIIGAAGAFIYLYLGGLLGPTASQ